MTMAVGMAVARHNRRILKHNKVGVYSRGKITNGTSLDISVRKEDEKYYHTACEKAHSRSRA